MKHLRNRFMWLGEIVHELLEQAMRTLPRAQPPKAAALVERGVRRMRAQFAESLQGEIWRRPGTALGLAEHVYGELVDRDTWLQLRARLQRCIDHFYAADLLPILAALPSYSWLAVETLGSFSLEDATIIVKPDAAWRNERGQVELLDWKTGLPSDDARQQLAIYGLYAQRVWGPSPTPMFGHVVYLDAGRTDTFEIDAAALAEAQQAVRASVARMQTLARRGVGEDQPDASKFVPTNDPKVCAHCVFRGVCGAPAAAPFANDLAAHAEPLALAPVAAHAAAPPG